MYRLDSGPNALFPHTMRDCHSLSKGTICSGGDGRRNVRRCRGACAVRQLLTAMTMAHLLLGALVLATNFDWTNPELGAFSV